MEENLYTPGPDSTHSSSTPLPQITAESLNYLDTAAKWAKFLAVLGFIGIGFMVLAGIFMGTVGTFASAMQSAGNFPFPMGIFGIFYIIMAAAYLMPVIYLNNFSNNISKAVAFRQTEFLTEALLSLKRNLKYVGIMTIVMIAFYFIFMIGIVIFAVSSVSHNF